VARLVGHPVGGFSFGSFVFIGNFELALRVDNYTADAANE
jgi:hypothetical protein